MRLPVLRPCSRARVGRGCAQQAAAAGAHAGSEPVSCACIILSKTHSASLMAETCSKFHYLSLPCCTGPEELNMKLVRIKVENWKSGGRRCACRRPACSGACAAARTCRARSTPARSRSWTRSATSCAIDWPRCASCGARRRTRGRRRARRPPCARRPRRRRRLGRRMRPRSHEASRRRGRAVRRCTGVLATYAWGLSNILCIHVNRVLAMCC